MANDLQNKSRKPDGAEMPSTTKQYAMLAASDSSPFTPEQRQILGNVYQLILGRRRERLIKTKPSAASAEREA